MIFDEDELDRGREFATIPESYWQFWLRRVIEVIGYKIKKKVKK